MLIEIFSNSPSIEIPSYACAPAISSKRTKLSFEILFRIDDVSFISTLNVDAPIEILSLAPTLVKILSTIPKVALVAGTKLPIWA